MADGGQSETSSITTPPYQPQDWQYGGQPKIVPDVIICAIYLLFYVVAGLVHKYIFLADKKKGQKFVMSAMTFGFCFVRLITFSTRLAWGVRPQNARLALVSNIFLNAGIPILYIINLVFAHRITRAQHPRLGWHRSLSVIGGVIIGLILATLSMLIYAGIQSAFTRDPELHHKMRRIQIYGSTFNTIIAILPLPMLLIGVMIPKRIRTEKFGAGRFRIKIAVLLMSSLLLTLRAVWSTTITWLNPVPLSQPMPWYLQKAIFYTVQLLTELIVVYMFIFVRINRIFYTPDSVPRGSYLDLPKSSAQLVPPPYADHDFPTVSTLHVYSEAQLFEQERTRAINPQYSSTSLLLDNTSGKWKLERQDMGDVYSPNTYPASERASLRDSTGSNYYYTPMNGSGELSKAPSLRATSTWNKERYNKEKDRRDSVKSGYSTSSPRWSGIGLAREVELQRYSFHDPTGDVVAGVQWPMPTASDASSVREAARDADGATRRERMFTVREGANINFQDRVERVMRDAQNIPTQPVANSTRVRSTLPRTLSPTRISSAPLPPSIPEVHVPAPERAVSYSGRSPAAAQSFEDAMLE